MVGSDTAQRAAPLLDRVVSNRYAQENLSDAAENLRAAYRRASKRRVEPTRDEKLWEQVRQAALSFTEAAKAIKTGRTKPKARWGRRLGILIGFSAVGGAAALAASEELRSTIFRDLAEPQEQGDVGRPETEVPPER
jgi:hypothetical protein